MPKKTRSNLDLQSTPIAELQYKLSRQQVSSELNLQSDPITTMSTMHSIGESDDDHKSQVMESVHSLQGN